MQLFYAPDINSPLHTLSEDESRHAVKVLRLGVGSTVRLVDGRGGMYEAVVEVASPRGCDVRVVSAVSGFGARPCRLVMGVAPTKNGDRFEWFLEKATEVGIDAIVPLECDNSERRVFRPDRAEKVLISAMKQSLKAALPHLAPLTPFRELVTRPFNGTKLIAHCRGGGNGGNGNSYAQRVPIVEALSAATDTLILIGPEGDFTEQEVALALENGFTPVSLGESRLRTETAALTAVIATYLKNS